MQKQTGKDIIRLRERSLSSLASIGFAVQEFPDYRGPASAGSHGHDILELNFIVAGSALHRIGGMERTCPPGSLGIIHYGQEHSLITDENGADVINLYLDPANHALPSLPTEFSAMVGHLFPPAVFGDMPAGLCSFLHFKEYTSITQLLRYCCAEQESMDAGYEIVMESALRIFLIACARQAMSDGIETLVADPSRWRLLEGLRLRLEREFASSQRLSVLADEIGISEAHLCRRFRSYTGLTPFAYLAQCRVRAAMQELRNSDGKIVNIALNSGFNDIGHFNRKFREIAHCSPSEYRRKFRH